MFNDSKHVKPQAKRLDANMSKGLHGHRFRSEVLNMLKDLKAMGLVRCIELDKRFALTREHELQFIAPLFIEINLHYLAIFPTTTIRSDRNKQNQWDAYGIKKAFNEDLLCIVVVTDKVLLSFFHSLSTFLGSNFLIITSESNKKIGRRISYFILSIHNSYPSLNVVS